MALSPDSLPRIVRELVQSGMGFLTRLVIQYFWFVLLIFYRSSFFSFFCPIGSIFPIPCPAGTYGSTLGLKTRACSGLCSAGIIYERG